MNWERVKNFLIILFIFINIFLVVFMFSSVRTSTSITKAVVNDTVNLLSANSISIDSKVIPLSVNNPGTFDVVAINVDSSYTSSKALTESTIKSEIKKALKALGIKDFAISKVNDYEYYAVQKVNEHFIFDSGISARADGNNITLSGVWYNQQSKPRGKNSDMLPVTAALIDFMNNSDRDKTIHNQVVDIQVGYCVPQYDSGMDHKSMPAVPCYSITTSNGSSFLYDAAAGTYLKIK